MSEDTTDASARQLIADLAADLEPVQPIPRLRSMVGRVLLLWALVAGIGIAVRGLRPDFLEMLLHMRGIGLIFAGLGLTGIGGGVAALALGIPGREAAARAGFAAAGVGMAAAAGIGTLLFLQNPIFDSPVPLRADLVCLAIALAVGLLPGIGIAMFGARAAPHRPLVLVLAAAAAMAALGGATAQATCPANDIRHLMLGHVIAPGVGALLLTLPLLHALRRAARS